MQYRVRAMLMAGLGLLAAQGRAAAVAAVPEATAAPTPAAASSADDAFKFFLQEAQVVTASRRAQKKSDSPVAIDVITREEIEKSGAKTIVDVLRFRVGVDVVEGNSFEGNPELVNVRGLPEEFAQSLQVLVDGRSIVTGTNSGVFWRRLPVDLDDIERIEIVRGPNSALFGANAGQGVINIITRKPGSGGGYRAELGTLGHRRAGLALDGEASGFGVRAHVEQNHEDSSFNPFGDQPGAGGNPLNSDTKFSLRATGHLWTDSDLDISAGKQDVSYSYPLAFGYSGDTVWQGGFAMARLNQAVNEQLGLELMLARRDEVIGASFEGGHETVYDGDLLGRLSLLDGRSQTVLGTSYRYVKDEFRDLFSNSNYSPTMYAYMRDGEQSIAYNNQQRAYLSEQISLTEWMSLALAASYEGSDTGGQQTAYQGALIFKPLEDVSLRLSGSKSPTMPSTINRYGRIELLTGFNGSTFQYTEARVDGAETTPPQVASYEGTLAWALFERSLELELTGYQMEIAGYPDFVSGGTFNIPVSFVPFLLGKSGTYSTIANANSLVLRGVESTVTWKPALGTRVQLNHTYEDVATANPTARYAYTTPWNKVNLFGNFDLPWGFNAGGGIAWAGQHNAYLASKGVTLAVPDQAKVDLRLGYHPVKDVELYAAGVNLDHQFRTESPDSLAVTQAYYGGVNVSFGGPEK